MVRTNFVLKQIYLDMAEAIITKQNTPLEQEYEGWGKLDSSSETTINQMKQAEIL